jgi:PAS domain S-box-containing protein
MSVPYRSIRLGIFQNFGILAVLLFSYVLSRFLVIVPAHPSAVWTSTGMVLAGIWLMGYRVVPAAFVAIVWIGWDTLKKIEGVYRGPPSWAVALIIALITILLVVVVVYLVRRYAVLRDGRLQRRIFLLVAGGVLGCIAVASVGAALLTAAGILPDYLVWETWLGWLVSDLFCLSIALPLAINWRLNMRGAGLKRKVIVLGVVLLLLSSVVMLSTHTRNLEWAQTRLIFDRRCSDFHQALIRHLASDLDVVIAVGSLFEATDRVGQSDFRRFVKPFLQRNRGFQSLEWVPYVRSAERRRYEELLAETDGLESRFSELNDRGESIEAVERPFYYPVVFAVPRPSGTVFGFDLGSQPVSLEAMARAAESGRAVVSGRVALTEAGRKVYGARLFVPVFREPVRSSTSRLDYPDRLVGFALGVVNFERTIETALQTFNRSDMISWLMDDTAPAGRRLLFTSDPRLVEEHLPEMMAAITIDQLRLHREFEVVFAERRWSLHFFPTPGFVNGQKPVQSWGVLGVGLFLISLLGTVIMMGVGRTRVTEQLVQARTYELSDANLVLQQEIRDRKVVEARLRRFQKAIDEGGYGIYITDTDGRIEYVNPAFTNVTGYSAADAIGQTPRLMKSGDNDPAYYQLLWSTILRGGLWSEEIINRRKDGSQYHAHQTIAPISDEQGNIEGFVAIQVDMTEIKRIEEELRQAQLKAESANRAKSEFLANMSYEIRTPLNAIIGFGTLLQSTVEDGRQKSYIEAINNSGKALLSLINDILDLSKIEAGQMRIEASPTRLKTLFGEMSQLFSLKMAEKELVCKTEMDPSLPPVLLLDEIRIRQVLLNLMGNAVKFTKTGWIALEAALIGRDDVAGTVDLEIAVTDTGIGIPEDQQQRIFDSFQQQDGQSTREYGGTGLGLSISKRLVEMMNGTFQLESRVGHGSRFSVSFRNVSIAAVDTVADTQKRDPLPGRTRFEPAVVLVVDDVATNRSLVREILTRRGLTVLEADSGKAALLAVEAHGPDLVLMDLVMPEMDGFEATRILKSRPESAAIPVIALTADSFAVDTGLTASTGVFDATLLKPLNLVQLLETLARFLRPVVDTGTPKAATGDGNGGGQAVAAGLSKALLTELEAELEEHWPNLKGAIDMDAVERFARRLASIGAEHRAPAVERFAAELSERIDQFAIDEIGRKLKSFPRWLAVLRQTGQISEGG